LRATADELKKLRDEKAKRLAELQVYKDLFGKLKALLSGAVTSIGAVAPGISEALIATAALTVLAWGAGLALR